MGYNNVTKSWATQKMFDDGNTWTSVVPACLTPGEYLVRHEIIALSDGYKLGGTQFYVRIPVFLLFFPFSSWRLFAGVLYSYPVA